MIKKITKQVAITIALIAALLVPLAYATPVGADVNDVCQGLALTGESCAETDGPSVESTIALVINVLSVIVGVAAVIMIIIGGLKYITSTGDSSNVQSAKNTILYAIIGLVIVALAQVIVRFVLNRVSAS
jgi:cytochrome bd-type quinol oxidase subunit 2